jgi:hypothetical protein
MSESIEIFEQGFVKNFKFVPYDPKLEANILGMLEGEQCERLIRVVKKKPSAETHGFYRGVILPLCQKTEMFRGWSLKEIHKYFASKHLRDVVEKTIGDTSVIIVTTLSTGECGQKRMNRFIQDVRQELSENNITTPDPVKQ